MSNKEKRGIYNVTFNDKKATPIKTDIELIEDEIIETIAMYVKGYHNFDRDKGLGSKHIKLHLDKNSDGYISVEELINLGNSLRKYLQIFKEPFVDKKGGKIYEWQNNKNIRFRCTIDKQRGGPQLPLSPSDKQIITFYSDRNIKERMKFKNHEVAKFYENKEELKNKEIQDFKNKLKQIIEKQNNKKDRDMER